MAVPFPGRFVATDTELQSVTVNPTVSLRATDWLALGAGLDVLWASAELKRQIQVGEAEGTAHLGGTAQAVGFNFGVLAMLVPRRLSVGLAYRTGVTLDFDLKAHFAVPPELAGTVGDQPAHLSLPLPHNLSVGLAITPAERLTLTADVHVTLWSDFHTLAVTFPSSDTQPLVAPRDWRDTVSLRLGAEIVAAHGLALRLGVGFDQSPVPVTTLDPTLPVSNRALVSAGLGYTVPRGVMRGFGVAVGWLGGFSAARSSTLVDFPGASYSQSVYLFSAALSYRWGAGNACDDCCGTGSCPGCTHCGAVTR
jgi:long-chain fatty acid transport protein